jgi:hypothetical protein
MGWSDPSPVLPNRYAGAPWTPAQLAQYAGAISTLMLRAGAAAARHAADSGGVMLWLSTDHFTLAPPLKTGDVGHVGLWDLLDAMWPQLAASLTESSFPWGVAVHPYDAGDPRQNLTADGIYTFATLRENVADYQCRKLGEFKGVPPEECNAWPQVQMWASEQGWPNPPQNKSMQARNICYAHALSLAQRLWSVTHNMFQGAVPSHQGGGGDYSLIDEPPVILASLAGARDAGRETYDAYRATHPDIFGQTDDHYCCTRWQTGCLGGAAAAAGEPQQ